MAGTVLHLVKDFSPPSQTFIYDLIVLLNKNPSDSFHSHIVGYYRKRLLAEERKYPGIISLAKRRDFLGRLSNFIRFGGNAKREIVNNLNKSIERLNPQIIHAHFAWTVWDLLIPYSQIHRLEIPVLISVHGTDILKTARQSSAKRLSLIHFSENFKTSFTVASDFMSKELINIGISKEKIYKVPNSISTNFISKNKKPAIERSSNNGTTYHIACVGRLVNWKGQRYLIEAVSYLIRKSKIRCKLTLIGDGPERKSLEKLVKELSIEDAVCFEGFVSHAKIPEILHRQDIYVQPSIYDKETGQCEAFGVSILEAISCGLPIIASRSGGIPDVIGKESEFARLIKPADSKELYLMLLEAYQSKVFTKDNSAYARERLNTFSQQKQVDKINSIYLTTKIAKGLKRQSHNQHRTLNAEH